MYGIPQEPLPKRLLFNIFLCDLDCFLEVTELTVYVDDTTLHSAAGTQECVIENYKDSS